MQSHACGCLPAGLMSSASTNKAQEEELPQPSYVYQSPGSSIREPGLGTGHSLSNPTYE